MAAILIFTGIIVGSVTLGNHAYDQYEKNGWIDKKKDGSVEIHNSWWISNPISRLTFTYRMLRSDEYGSISKKRSLVSLMIEWYLQNFATDISIAMQIITMSVNILTSNGMFWVIPNEIRKHSDDVYFDNDDWWEDLFKWFKKEN